MDWNTFKQAPRWDVILWMVWVAMFFVLEFIGFGKNPQLTFTEVVKASTPRWIIAAFLGWLTYHFLIQP